jgi:prolipoprotein diacylglyceryltransferase
MVCGLQPVGENAVPFHSLHLGPWDLRTWTLFGQVPFLALMLALYFAGRRRGWSWRSALLSTAALAGGLSLGTALLSSVLGAVAGGIGMWLLSQKLLGLRRAPWATLALGLAAVIAVGRWGCLLNDCCFGRVTNLPWAIHYGAGGATFILHRALGFIAPHAQVSLPVHPYPLYESAGLLLWLSAAFHLARRLRSEAALLLFTAAYDLALRGLIDGTRAMVNVWWALLGSFAGLNLFQWALLLAALAALAAGLVLERRARARPVVEAEPVREPAPVVSWAIFVGLWAIGWLTDSAQTVFLHRVLAGALGLAALGLRLPARLPAPNWVQVWAAPALAAVLVLFLGVHVQRLAQASDGMTRAGGPGYGWLYEVDRKHEAIVRVGTVKESPEAINQRRAALDLPAAAPVVVPPSVPPVSAGRTWVGGGVLGGGTHYEVSEGCSNDYTIYDRKAGGGWIEAQREIPATPSSVWWFGGRGLALFESQTKTVHVGDPASDAIYRYAFQTYAGQGWAEWEHPNVSVGIGGILGLQNVHTEGAGSSLGVAGRPSFHLRLGASFLSLDGGLYDRSSPVGLSAGHIGLSGAIGRGFTRVRHPDDTAVRYFVGAVVFPGADMSQNHMVLGGGVEVFATRRLVLGLQGGAGDPGFAIGYVRAAVDR